VPEAAGMKGSLQFSSGRDCGQEVTKWAMEILMGSKEKKKT
jgi:hypothetical protein